MPFAVIFYLENSKNFSSNTLLLATTKSIPRQDLNKEYKTKV